MKPRAAQLAVAALVAAAAVVLPASAVGAHATAPQAVHVATPITPNGSWLVYHHDDGHTGFDASIPPALSATTGWTSPVLDQSVFGEPLVYQGIVYVATLNNTVYALNQTDGSLIWHLHLRAPETTGWQCGNVSPQGILGTPVIDPASNHIFVVTLGSDDDYRLEGINLTTLGDDIQTIINTPASTFDWTIEQERGALAVHNGYLYVPFGGRAGDCGTYHGYVYAVPTNGGAPLPPYVTGGSGSGFWGAGGVVVDDSTGKVFETSGNGTGIGCDNNPNGTSTYENDAVDRLSATVAREDSFYPLDWQNNWCNNDQDLGSASMVLISPTLAFQTGKWGQGFLVNPKALGGMNGQLFPGKSPYTGADVCHGNHSDANFGSYSYAAPYVYVGCDGNGLVGLKVDPVAPSFSLCDATCAAPTWTAGGNMTFGPPIVAGGVVWAIDTGGSGLYGFDASTGAQVFQSAGLSSNHFSTPSEAGGQLFVASDTTVQSFNMVGGCTSVVGGASPSSPQPVGTPVTVTGTASGCPNPNPLYEFWIQNPGSNTYEKVQAYSTTPTFNWTTTALVGGTYSIIVLARDSSSAGFFTNGVARWDAFTLVQYTLTAVPCTNVSANAAPGSPQPQGTPVTITATPTGCPNPSYQFWVLAPGSSTWQLAQKYSTSAVFGWSTAGKAAGTWNFAIWARDSSSTGVSGDSLGTWDAYATLQYHLTTTACTSVSGSSSPPNTAPTGIPVTITGAATGCPTPRYEFWVLYPGTQTWLLAKAYSASAFGWSTSGKPVGTYTFSIWARDANSPGTSRTPLGTWDAYTTLKYTLTSTACTGITASSSPPNTATVGTSVTITGSATGCPNPEYEFWILKPGSQTWLLALGYSSSPTFNWSTAGQAKGTYHFSVWARDAASVGTFPSPLGRWDAYAAPTYSLT